MQLDPLEKLHHGSSTSQHHPMILVAGSLSQKPRLVETSAYSRDKDSGVGTGLDLRKAQVKWKSSLNPQAAAAGAGGAKESSSNQGLSRRIFIQHNQRQQQQATKNSVGNLLNSNEANARVNADK